MTTAIAPSTAPDPYVQERRDEIQRWLAAPPDWGTRLMAKPGKVAANAASQLVPVAVLRGSLRALERTAGRVSDSRSVLRRAGVASLDELAGWPLRSCDQLATRIERRAMMLGGTSGAAFGIGGAAGMVADVPTLLTLALRTIHRTAYCYGEDWQTGQQRGMVIGVFALASANSIEEKQAAWAALQGGHALLDAAWRDGVERVAERELAKDAAQFSQRLQAELAKDAAQFSLQTLAARIGSSLGRRKAAGVAPVIGAVIGGAVNASYLHDIAVVAQRVLRDRWMRRNRV